MEAAKAAGEGEGGDSDARVQALTEENERLKREITVLKDQLYSGHPTPTSGVSSVLSSPGAVRMKVTRVPILPLLVWRHHPPCRPEPIFVNSPYHSCLDIYSLALPFLIVGVTDFARSKLLCSSVDGGNTEVD